MKKFIKKLFFNNSSLIKEDNVGYQQFTKIDTHPQQFHSNGRELLAFTVAEIVVSMVVMAVIASVVVPITRDKFEKVDYASYYLGYKAAQDFVMLMPKSALNKDGSGGSSGSACSISSGACFTTPLRGNEITPISKSECESIKDSLGIKTCPVENDRWAAAVKHCGGVNRLISTQEAQHMIDYIYGYGIDVTQSGSGYTGNFIEGSLNRELARVVGIPDDANPTLYVSNESDTGVINPYPGLGNDYVMSFSWGRNSGSSNGFFIFCKAPGVNVIRSPKEPEEKEEEDTSNALATGEFCEILYNNLNLSESHKKCDVLNTDVQQAAANKDFSGLTPHMVLQNGLKIYIASDYGEISQLSDSLEESDRIGFTVYIDVDGNRSKSRLYDDVFPFYIVNSGKVIPGYDASIVAGANSEKNLAFDLLYDDFDASGNRKLKRLSGYSVSGADEASFKNGACITGYVKSQKYCSMDPSTGVTVNGINCATDKKVDCRMKVRKPLKVFN